MRSTSPPHTLCLCSPDVSAADVGDNDFGSEGMEILARGLVSAPSLIKVNVSGNKIGATGAEYLADALCSDGCEIQELRCHNNSIGDRGALALSDAFKLSGIACKVTYLGLMNNGIEDRAASALFTVIASGNMPLQKLGLHGNLITAQHGIVEYLLEHSTTLTHLALGHNRIARRELQGIVNFLNGDGGLSVALVQLILTPRPGDQDALALAYELKMSRLVSPRLDFASTYFVV